MIWHVLTIITATYIADISHTTMTATNNSKLFGTVAECEISRNWVAKTLQNNQVAVCAKVFIK